MAINIKLAEIDNISIDHIEEVVINLKNNTGEARAMVELSGVKQQLAISFSLDDIISNTAKGKIIAKAIAALKVSLQG